MWWLISLCMFIFACVNHNDSAMIASGMFAIAGSIDAFSGKFGKKNDEKL